MEIPKNLSCQRLLLLAGTYSRERTLEARRRCAQLRKLHVRSLGPSQLAQGAMPALAAALRVALLGRLALASVVPIGHDGLAAAANLALRPVGARPRGSACACSTHGSDVRGGPLVWGGAARDVRQGHRQGLAWAAGGARRARQKKLRAHRLQLPRDRDVRCRARPRPTSKNGHNRFITSVGPYGAY